jgi:anti-sigma factor RsiW
MNHNEIQDRLEAFADRQLADPERREIESHLHQCQACGEEIRRLNTISRMVFRPVPTPPTEYFVSRVMAQIRERQSRPVAAFGAWWRVSAVAMLALAGFLVFTAPSDESPEGRPSTQTVLLADAEPVETLLDLTEEI